MYPFFHHCTPKVQILLYQLQRKIMATMEEVLADLDTISTETTAYIAARDAIDVDLKAQLAAAIAAQGGVPPAVQAQIDAAFTKAEADKAALTPPAPAGGAPA